MTMKPMIRGLVSGGAKAFISFKRSWSNSWNHSRLQFVVKSSRSDLFCLKGVHRKTPVPESLF